MSSQDTTVSDTLAVVKALNRHLKEDNCPHSIKYILRESLKSKSGLREPTPNPLDDSSNHQRLNSKWLQK